MSLLIRFVSSSLRRLFILFLLPHPVYVRAFVSYLCVCVCPCQIMRGLIKSSLQTAHGNSRTSIAIPAIGTGNLRVPADITCWVMYDEVDKFSQSNAATSLKDVRFVVYDKDPSSIAVSLLVSQLPSTLCLKKLCQLIVCSLAVKYEPI